MTPTASKTPTAMTQESLPDSTAPAASADSDSGFKLAPILISSRKVGEADRTLPDTPELIGIY